ncbi:hypothetical protein OB13_03255 [Pontibacter sp. HJ8]
MHKYFTPEDSGFFFGILLLSLCSCSPRVEQDAKSQLDTAQAAAEQPVEVLPVESAKEPIEEAYFDLIANTSGCLGEDLWIGGKVESTNKVALSKAGAITNEIVFEVKDLTATGLNTNSYYTLRDTAGTLKAFYDEEGVLRIQVQEGPLKLVPRAGHGSILVAYHAPAAGEKQNSNDGSWLCQ